MENKIRESFWQVLAFYVTAEVICFVICRLYDLPAFYEILMGGILLVFLPMWRANHKKGIVEDKRLSDAQVYMEQLLYAFTKQEKMLSSLEDVLLLFPEGSMRDTLSNALHKMRYDYEEEDVVWSGLQEIEKEYENDRLHTIHTFLYKVERIGGAYEGMITLLLKDLNGWRKRMDVYRKDCKKSRHNVVIAILVALCVCLTANSILPARVDVSDNGVRIVSTIVFFVALLLVYTAMDRKLALNWLKHGSGNGEAGLAEKYRNYMTYSEKKEQKFSVCLSAVPMLAAVFAGMKGMWQFAVIAGVLAFFLFQQHKIGHALARKNLTREIEKAFPKWLMELSLLLQIENVQVAIAKTVDTAPEVLKPALLEFQEKITANPEEARPYLEFLNEFPLPQVQSAMKMLYAVSMGNGGSESEQTQELVARNMNLMEQAETLKNEEALAGMYLLFLAPALVGALKLIIDMTIFLLAFFVQAGSLGGR